MTDLEDRIRASLQDPRRAVPPWPDPMPRIRRTARRQRAARGIGAAALTALIAAAVLAPATALRPASLRPAAAGPGGGSPPAAGLRVRVSPRAAAPALPSWTSQLGGQVAYECGLTICVMRPDGTGRRTLSAAFPLWDAAWSPDGAALAFRGYYGPGDGQYDLYAVNVNGCRLTRLTRGRNGASPAWSPAGRQLAFSPAGGGIDIVGADGRGLRRLTIPGARSADTAPAWSAAGRLAFVRSAGGSAPAEIYAMSPAGRGVTALTHGPPGFSGPSWSPDGKLIAFVAGTRPAGVIEVARASGAGARRVSPRSWASSSPTWTPGGQVVFLARAGGRESAYIVNPDGTGLRLLYRDLDAANAAQIAWGPDAGRLAAC